MGRSSLETKVVLFPERKGGSRALPIGLPYTLPSRPIYHFYLKLGQFAQLKPAYFLESDDITEPEFQKAEVAKNTCPPETKENY